MNQAKAKAVSILHVALLSITFISLKNHVTMIPIIFQEVGAMAGCPLFLGCASYCRGC